MIRMSFAAGDVIYEIEDQKLIKTRSHEAKQTKKETLQWQKHPLKAIFFMRYYLTYLKKNWGLQVMMLTLCGITMAILVSLSDISETFLASQQQSLDQIANREIVIASQDLNGKGYYDANLPLLEEGAMDTIAQLDHVQSVYPFFEGYCDEATANGKTVIDELVIQPYAPDRQIANQCHMTSGEAGQIYLSSYASEFFEMDRLDGANPFTSLPSARWNDVYLTRCANLGYLTEFSKEFVYEFYSCHLCAVGLVS